MIAALVMTKLFTVFLIQIITNTITEPTNNYLYEGQLESSGTIVWQLDNNGNFLAQVIHCMMMRWSP